MQTKLEARFHAGPEAAGSARRSLEELASELEDKLLNDLRLLVSELVTNCVRHAGIEREEWIRLTVRMSRDRVRVQVCDEGLGFVPRVVMPNMYQASGWGLYFVSRLTDRWGVSRSDETCVWFEVDRADRASGRPQSAKRMWSTSPSRTS
jgi:anti-sigma regulatory factor (Ser/Thr protein kinase)